MEKYTKELLKEAQKSIKTNDIPIGALIVEDGKIIAKAHNMREKKHSITKHAEIIAIEKASKKKKTWHLNNCELYVTLEPCQMCLEAIKQSRIKKIYYILNQEKTKVEKYPEKIQINDNNQSKKILKNFFKLLRK